MEPIKFVHAWVAETVRLREAHHGPLQDQSESIQAIARQNSLSARILARAYLLGKREGLIDLIENWVSIARITLLIIIAAAIFTGIGSAVGTLGNGNKPVNIYLTLVAILGINTLALLFWLVGFLFSSSDTASGLGRTWLWLTRKIAHGPNAALVPQALISVLSRQRALQPIFGTISNALWLCALIAALAGLIMLLSARSYTFQWETTLLSPESFIWLTTTLGWLPSKMGFSIPTPELILLSDGNHTVPAHAQTMWSSWLIGCIVVYGIAPRLIALISTVSLSKSRLKVNTIDTKLPGFAELRNKLDPPSQNSGTDGPAPAYKLGKSGLKSNINNIPVGQEAYILALELANHEAWPPANLSQSIHDLGVIDTREQRKQALHTLINTPPKLLLIACDARQTPDRGSINFIHELSQHAKQTNILLMFTSSNALTNTNDRHETWLTSLEPIGIARTNIHLELESAINWLQQI